MLLLVVEWVMRQKHDGNESLVDAERAMQSLLLRLVVIFEVP